MTADWCSLYPFTSHEMLLGAWRNHYLDEGPGGGSPEPLVMVHGNPTWSFYFRNLILPFRDRYRVIVPDHLGCGLSDKPQDYPYCLATHTANLVQLIKHLDLSGITLLVHDWGGAIGLGAALQLPERVARLVLLNTGAFPPPFIPWRIRACRIPWLGTWAVRRLNLFARAALRMAVHKHSRMTPAVRAGLLAPYDSWEHRVAIDRFVADIPTGPGHPTWDVLADIERRLPSLADRPVQLVWGMRDWCFRPSCLERFLKLFPEAETHRLMDAGHYVVEDAHEQIVPLVQRFLEAHPLGSLGDSPTIHP